MGLVGVQLPLIQTELSWETICRRQRDQAATRGRTTFMISRSIAAAAQCCYTGECETSGLCGLRHRAKVPEAVGGRSSKGEIRTAALGDQVGLRRAASRERPRISQVPRQQTGRAPAMAVICVSEELAGNGLCVFAYKERESERAREREREKE
jgi:hypothetical protein